MQEPTPENRHVTPLDAPLSRRKALALLGSALVLPAVARAAQLVPGNAAPANSEGPGARTTYESQSTFVLPMPGLRTAISSTWGTAGSHNRSAILATSGCRSK